MFNYLPWFPHFVRTSTLESIDIWGRRKKNLFYCHFTKGCFFGTALCKEVKHSCTCSTASEVFQFLFFILLTYWKAKKSVIFWNFDVDICILTIWDGVAPYIEENLNYFLNDCLQTVIYYKNSLLISPLYVLLKLQRDLWNNLYAHCLILKVFIFF